MVCPYCAEPMTGRRTAHCGALGCKRRWNADRMRDYMRERYVKGLKYKPRNCVVCGETFTPGNAETSCCSRQCTNIMRYGSGPRQRPTRRRLAAERKLAKAAEGTRGELVWTAGRCAECGEMFAAHNNATIYCSARCKERASRARRRAREHGMDVTRVRRHRIYERDNWTCYLCGYPVDRAAVVPALDAPVLDHVVALASGGAHTEHNLRTAHFYCNSVKGDRALTDVA